VRDLHLDLELRAGLSSGSHRGFIEFRAHEIALTLD
jgi:hypothetical protein